ncbi:MAG: hypothetical protein K2F69_06930 [Bacteroidaceae bacterium]|nr:hypothetical protein [Bacteroidaceae bacterium]
MTKIDKSIIQKVKDKLGVNTDNVVELLKLLRIQKVSKHPDKFTDKIAKETAHEEFTLLSSLYSDLNSYIQQCQASATPILAVNNSDIIEFNHIKDIDAKDVEIEHLKQENESLKFKLQQEKETNVELHGKIEELSKQRIKSIHDEIKAIYSPRKTWSGIGLAAILVSLTATFPVVKDFLNQIGATSDIAMAVIRFISFVTIFKWSRSWVVNKVVENIEYKILNNSSINGLFNIKTKNIKYSSSLEYYFYESDIVSCIDEQLARIFFRILMFGNYNKIVKILTEDIIIQLDRKNLIKRTESDGLNKVFIVKRMDSDL